MRSAVVQLAQQPCSESSRNPALHQEVTDPVEEWDRVGGGETLLDGLQLLHGSATPQGIDEGVFFGALSQQLGGFQVEKQPDPFVMASLWVPCHASGGRFEGRYWIHPLFSALSCAWFPVHGFLCMVGLLL